MKIEILVPTMLSGYFLSGCYFIDFFQQKSADQGVTSQITSGVLGQPLGDRAGGLDEAALAAVHAETTTIGPASVRPDPDLFARRLLRQFHPEGATMAQTIGRIENFRSLLGGASEDFQTMPQETYDATSLLAMMSVSQVVCEALVSPNEWQHQGWTTVLPFPDGSEAENVAFLAQRFLGKARADISLNKLADLESLIASDETGYERYIPVCVALSLDSDVLFL